MNISGSARYPALLWSSFALLVLISLFGMLTADKVQAGHGLGWDGKIYADMVRSFPELLWNGELSRYYAGRMLPPALIAAALALFGVSPTTSVIVTTFALLNFCLLLFCWFLWKRIGDALAFQTTGRAVSFAGIFLTFSVAKLAFFYSVLIDTAALTAGMAMLLFYLEKRRWALVAVTIAGAFCWPTAAVTGALLLLLMHAPREAQEFGWRPLRYAAPSLIILLALSTLALALLSIRPICGAATVAVQNVVEPLPFNSLHEYFSADRACGMLRGFVTGVPTLGIFLLAALILLFGTNAHKQILPAINQVRFIAWMQATLVIGVPWVIIRSLTNPELVRGADPLTVVIWSLFPQEGMFFLAIVSLAVFWGPVFLVAAVAWRHVSIEAGRLGLGVVAILLIALPLALATEPRYITLQWPFLTFCVAAWLDRRGTSRDAAILLTVLVFFFCKVWLTVNYERWTGDDMADLQEFPKQMYFMHFGFWMSWQTFIPQAVLVGLSGLCLRNMLSAPSSMEERPARASDSPNKSPSSAPTARRI